jgi:CysZ protein
VHIIPSVIIHSILFSFFLWASILLTKSFFNIQLPEEWWSITIAILLIIFGATIFYLLGTALIVVIGTLLSAHFYEALTKHAIIYIHPVYKKMTPLERMRQRIKNTWRLLGWYSVIQFILLILNIIPLAVGPFSHIVLAYITTSLLIAWAFLDYTFDYYNLPFSKRKKWCIQNIGVVTGFGAAVFLFLLIPVLNFFVPSVAVISGALLFQSRQDANVVI